MTREGILTGGTWCVDRNVRVDRWPGENGRASILENDTSGGGSACNLALDVRKLDPGFPLATIGLVGDDEDGRFLLELADANDIDRSRMTISNSAATDYTLAFASGDTGQRTHVSYHDSSHELTPDHFDFTGLNQRIFHLGLPGIHRRMDGVWGTHANGWAATLVKARDAGLVTNLELPSIDGARLAELVRPCLPHLDLLVVNDAEIGGIAGIETVRGDETIVEACAAAARAVLARGVSRLVVVHFPHGAVAVSRDGGLVHKPSVRVPPAEIAGANGAGDAFAAGFLYAIHEDRSLTEALELAHAAAAASLRNISTTGAVATWSDCLALAAGWGWRQDLGPT